MRLFHLTSDVWWGDYEAAAHVGQEVKAIINVAHSFSVRRGRNVYWANLERVNWRTLYFRIAKKDAEEFTPHYAQSLAAVVDIVSHNAAFPLLCHCQMGGHRGPSAAIFSAWHLGGRKLSHLESLNAKAMEFFPPLSRSRDGGYYKSMLPLLRSLSK